MPWRRKWQPTPVFLPGEFHGQRSLGYSHSAVESLRILAWARYRPQGYSPWDGKDSDVTEYLITTKDLKLHYTLV